MLEEIKRLEKIIVNQNKKIELMRKKYFSLHSSIVKANRNNIEILDNEVSPVEIIDRKSDVTIIAFSGMMTELGMPRAEFFQTLSRRKNVNILFLKDFKQLWYLNGLLGISSNIEETVEFIQSIIPLRTKKVITLGTSAGGFAAIIFAELLNASASLAFAPQTFINEVEFNHFKSMDSRLSELSLSKYVDLKNIIHKNTVTSHNIFVCEKNKKDMIHALNLENLVSIHKYSCDSHNIAKVLKERCILDDIIIDTFN